MNNLKRLNTPLFCLMTLLVLASHGAMATEPDTRVTVTTQGLVSAQSTASEKQFTRNEYSALTTSGDRGKSSRASDQQKTLADVSAAPNTDFWFFDAWVALYSDVDRDGYFSGIELTFDADTIYGIADVYAVVYLSYEYGEWNEYAVTEDFTIFGTSETDEYVVETDLVAGYPTGDYDILIELFDSFDNSFVASIGPEGSSDLAILPLEDMNRDALSDVEPRIVVNSGGGGSIGWFLLLSLGLAGGVLRRR